MPDSNEQILRVVDWRVNGLRTRLAQCVLVMLLAYGGTKSALVFAWFAAACAIAVVDAWVFQRLQ